MRPILAVVLWLAMACAASAQQPVELLITVCDERGQPAPAVSKSDLALVHDDQALQIEELRSAADAPVQFVILLDLSGSGQDKAGALKRATLEVFDAASLPGSKGALAHFNDDFAAPTRFISRGELEDILEAVGPRGGTKLYAAVSRMAGEPILSPLELPGARRLLFLVSDGEDTSRQNVTLDRAVDDVLYSRVALFPIGLMDRPVPPPWHGLADNQDAPKMKPKDVLRYMARETGGCPLLLRGPSDLQALKQQVAEMLRGQYWVSFRPPETTPDKPHQVRIEYRKQGKFRVSHPTAYVMGRPQ